MGRCGLGEILDHKANPAKGQRACWCCARCGQCLCCSWQRAGPGPHTQVQSDSEQQVCPEARQVVKTPSRTTATVGAQLGVTRGIRGAALASTQDRRLPMETSRRDFRNPEHPVVQVSGKHFLLMLGLLLAQGPQMRRVKDATFSEVLLCWGDRAPSILFIAHFS